MKSAGLLLSSMYLVVVAAISGCSPRVNQKDFESLYRSGKAISSAAEVGVNYSSFSTLVQELAREISIAKDRASNPVEKDMAKKYQEALTSYQDSLTVWKNSIDGASYDWIPNGEIYVEDELKPLVTKYSLQTQPRSIEITGHNFETISDSAIQRIWANADKSLEAATSIYTNK